jgi:hypothetical protein
MLRGHALVLLIPFALGGCASREGDVESSDELVGGALPIDLGHAETVAGGERIFMPGPLFSMADGSTVAVGSVFGSGALFGALRSGSAWSEPGILPTGPASSATGARVGGKDVIYFPTSATAPGFSRVELGNDGTLSEPQAVVLDGSPVAPYWPQIASLPSGGALLAFVQPQRRAFLGVAGPDGLRFAVRPAPTPPGDLPLVLAHVGATRAGQWVFTYQVGDAAGVVTSYVRTSSDDGVTFSEARVVAPESQNVHDAFVAPRAEEGVDLYYVHANPALGNELTGYRRALHEDGRLGPEQALTANDVGHVEKPQARRLADGRLVLTFARKVAPSRFDVMYAPLAGEAP